MPQRAFHPDSLESSHPISIPVKHPAEISQIFDTITYRKGAAIIRMMEAFITKDTLRQVGHIGWRRAKRRRGRERERECG